MLKCLCLLVSIVGVCANAECQNEGFPYKLKMIDYAIIPVAVGAELYARHLEDGQKKMTYDELILLNKNDINSFERSAASNWHPNLDKISNLTTYALLASPSVLLLPKIKNKKWCNVATYGVMYLEAALLTMGIKDLTKTIAKRKRPYLYNSDVSIEDKEDYIDNKEAYDSFFSGHTAGAFCAAVFLSKTYTDIYGKGTASKIIWGVSLTVASTTGYLRYKSGNHYPTDVLVGAVVGSAIGYLIPVVHKINSDNVSLVLMPGSVNFAYKF